MSEPKRFKPDHTSIEQLTNELFLQVFVYLNGIDAVYAFSQLNNRFHYLLNNYINTFDFKSINTAKFDYVTKNHDVRQWRSLRLSENDETPGQVRLFCQLYPPQQYIFQLESLSLLNLRSEFTNEFIAQLVSLTIGPISGDNIQPLELPSLQRLVVTECRHTNWIMNFTQLKSLEYTVEHICNREGNLTLPTTLNQLKLFYDEVMDGKTAQTSLRQMSQLTKLALCHNEKYSLMPDGRTWL